jgi:hypothetical protein
LIELLNVDMSGYDGKVHGDYTENLADHLLANGVIVPPKKGCEYCKGRAYTKRPLTVITKYGRRIELAFEFCPNCGRKMNTERSNENAE